MTNCETDIKTHKKTGSNQSNRMLNALYPDFIRLDERTIKDLIVSTNTLSRQINFFDNNNIVTGKWDSFFQWETTSILAQIAQLDITALSQEFQLKKRELLFIENLEDQKKVVLPFFDNITTIVNNLLEKTGQLPNDFEVKSYFRNTQDGLIRVLEAIKTELSVSTDLLFTLQHHLFNKKLQSVFGLLHQWKKRCEKQIHINLESYPKHSPQYALYLAFLKLFGYAQDNLNEFTKRHLDFYYNKILHLYPEKATPDSVHLCIEPHKNRSSFLIEKGSIFLGGKDSQGRNKYYECAADVAINQAKVEHIYGSSVKDDAFYFQDITDLNASGQPWNAFPGDSVYSQIGFALATPMLYLRGGHREITITFKNANNQKVQVLPRDFEFYLTAEDGWYKTTADFEEGIITLTIPIEEKGIIPFNTEIHEGVDLETSFPTLKIISGSANIANNPTFEKVELSVKVTNYKHFKLFNNTGEIDHTKSFEPFGSIPKNGNTLIFACKEFFQKNILFGKFNVKKDNENVTSILHHYSDFAILKNGHWQDHPYSRANTFVPPELIDPTSYDFIKDEPLKPEDTNGFMKFTLNYSAYDKNTFLNNFITASKAEGSTALPYVPNILDISFEYTTAFSEFTVSNTASSGSSKLFQIYPKGYSTIKGNRIHLLPSYTNEGELYLGIKNMQGGNSLNLLFQVADGTANPRQEAIDLSWKYLLGQEWRDFENNNIHDATNGLTQSGIVTLNSPYDLKLNEQTEWPSDCWWIKIEASTRIDAVCKVIGIHNQALKASLVDYESQGTDFIEHTEQGTISKLKAANPHIKKINQPYRSFSGKAKEDQNRFYQRTSERLRHKGRAISIWDYEKLVLDNFPEVHQVKCLNHHRYDSQEINNSSAGYVTLIPVAKTKISHQPLVSLGTMKRIRSFLSSKTSPHVRLAVKAPKLEKIKLRFNVKYVDRPGTDISLYDQQLQKAINAFLSPWAYDENAGVNFQKPLTKSTLIHLIEQQSYVDYLSDFKVDQLILEESSDQIARTESDIDTIVPKTVYSLFIPDTHDISPITSCCS